MRVGNDYYRTIWLKQDRPDVVQIIEQRLLPHQFVIEDLATVEEMARAIKEMHVRGAGLIGASGGYGMYLAARRAADLPLPEFRRQLRAAAKLLVDTRPTAVNLKWAVDRALSAIEAASSVESALGVSRSIAGQIADEEAESCRLIGEHGVAVIEEIAARRNGQVVNILTHCNAGWLAMVDYGTALAPIYAASARGLRVHVWVDETRPANQGARLTAWELGQEGIPHTVISDNTGGHLMQNGLVDLVIVGTDRTTYTGDVANKIGTYLKALAAHDNGVPFYVAAPSSSIDWHMRKGRDIPIEERDATEVRFISGLAEGRVIDVLLTPASSPAANYAFDVTPARLVTGIITERGICPATEAGILGLFPERRAK
jgi:methylthioribose-1-phosphate isomerase